MYENFDNVIKSVVREHHFSPAVVGDFYLDSAGYDGIEYWYNDVLEMHQELKQKTSGNNV